MSTFELFFDQGTLDFFVQFFGLFSVGVLLAILGWLISYLLSAIIGLIKRSV